MALEGFLQEFGLADILQLIYFQRKTGVLNIEGKADTIKLSFINGCITDLESRKGIKTHRLGKILIKKGLITQKDLNTALETQKTKGIKLGNIFVRQGLVSKDDIAEIMQEQIIEIIAQIFAWKEGRYEFIPQEISIDKELAISLDTQHLLMGGVRVVDELSVIEGKLDLDNIYKKVREPDSEQLSDAEKEILNLVDGDSDVSTIINISPYEDFETSKAIISLEEKGLIEPAPVLPIKKKTVTPAELRGSIYIAILVIVLIVLMFTFKGNFEAFKAFRETKISMNMERLKTNIEIHNVKHGRYPENLEIVTEEQDPWGKPYIYKLTGNGSSFTLFSSGPDGIVGTNDDVH